MQKYVFVLLLVLSLSFATWNYITTPLQGTTSYTSAGKGVRYTLGVYNANLHEDITVGVRIKNMSITFPKNSPLSVNGPSIKYTNTVLCDNESTSCNNQYCCTRGVFEYFNITSASDTASGVYSFSFTVKGVNVYCEGSTCIEGTVTRSHTFTNMKYINITSRADAYTAITHAMSKRDTAISMNTSVYPYVQAAGFTCKSAGTSYTTGKSKLNSAISYYSAAFSYMNNYNYNYLLSIDRSERSASYSSQSMNSFQAAKSAAQTCLKSKADSARIDASNSISSATTAKSNAQTYLTQAGTSCTDAQTSFSTADTSLSSANSDYSTSTNYYNTANYTGSKTKADDAKSNAESANSTFIVAQNNALICIAANPSTTTGNTTPSAPAANTSSSTPSTPSTNTTTPPSVPGTPSTPPTPGTQPPASGTQPSTGTPSTGTQTPPSTPPGTSSTPSTQPSTSNTTTPPSQPTPNKTTIGTTPSSNKSTTKPSDAIIIKLPPEYIGMGIVVVVSLILGAAISKIFFGKKK